MNIDSDPNLHWLIRQWYLELAAEAIIPLWMLVRPTVGHALNVQVPAGAPVDCRMGHVTQLVEDGALWVGRVKEGNEWEHISINDLCQHPQYFNDGAFGLTTTGGMEWERTGRANWSRYVLEEYDSKLEIARLACQDLDRLRATIGRCETQESIRIKDPSLLRIECIERFPVTYWKTLDLVHAVRFEYVAVKRQPELSHLLAPPFDGRSIEEFYRWHDVPWEHPEWVGEPA